MKSSMILGVCVLAAAATAYCGTRGGGAESAPATATVPPKVSVHEPVTHEPETATKVPPRPVGTAMPSPSPLPTPVRIALRDLFPAGVPTTRPRGGPPAPPAPTGRPAATAPPTATPTDDPAPTTPEPGTPIPAPPAPPPLPTGTAFPTPPMPAPFPTVPPNELPTPPPLPTPTGPGSEFPAPPPLPTLPR